MFSKLWNSYSCDLYVSSESYPVIDRCEYNKAKMTYRCDPNDQDDQDDRVDQDDRDDHDDQKDLDGWLSWLRLLLLLWIVYFR